MKMRYRLCMLMIERDMTIPQLSVASGVSPNTINDVRRGRGRLRLDQAVGIAKAFGITLDEFVKDVEFE